MTARGSAEPGQSDLLSRYAELVRSWAPRLDLVAPGDLDRFDCRHIDDSIRALDLVRSAPPGPAVDVGSGAGLPGIPLAICTPERPWRLLEPRRRRAAFLEEVVRELGLPNCEVVAETAEKAAAEGLAAAHSIAVARALATPGTAAKLCRPLVAPGGMVVLFVGANVQEEVPESVPAGEGLIKIDV